jgi:hypothetical protein
MLLLPTLSRPAPVVGRVARERRAAYNAPTVGTDTTPAALRDAVTEARTALERVHDLAHEAAIGGGEVGALLDLLAALDSGRAGALALTARVQRHDLAARTTGLTLDSLLACQSPLPGPQRRALAREAETLRSMPHLAAAVRSGAVPASALPAIVGESQPLDAAARAELDDRFGDVQRLDRLGPDELLDAVRDAAAAVAPAVAEREALRPIEDRFLAVQPRLDGSLTGYFELDAEGGGALLEAVEAAAPPPSSGPRDVSRHALDGRADGPAAPPSWRRRSRGRQRADGLVRIAEDYLAGRAPRPTTGGTVEGQVGPTDTTVVDVAATPGSPDEPAVAGTSGGDCRPRRARPRILVLTDVATLTGHDELADASRLLWAAVGSPPRLTAAMVRRLASDADLQLVLHDDGRIFGVSAPTAAIPAPVRATVLARDRGCRFPGCSAPVRYVDLHHVVGREAGGPTVVENLVGLCRRHHTAVTQGNWQLTMTPDGTVTVRRGRRTATSDPPHRRQLRSPPSARSSGPAAPARPVRGRVPHPPGPPG